MACMWIVTDLGPDFWGSNGLGGLKYVIQPDFPWTNGRNTCNTPSNPIKEKLYVRFGSIITRHFFTDQREYIGCSILSWGAMAQVHHHEGPLLDVDA